MQEIIDQLKDMPVIDAHEHLRGHAQCRPCEGVTDFFLGYYLSSILPYADRKLAARIQDGARDDRQRWGDFVKLWPFVRCTGYGNVVMRILKAWGLEEDCTDHTYAAALDRLRSRTPEMSRRAYQQAGIERSVTHFLSHPCCGGLENVGNFLKGDLSFESGFHPLLGTLPLHEFFDREGIKTVEQVGATSVTKLDHLVSTISTLIDRVIKLGVVGLKDHAAYTRGLSFGSPDRVAADDEFQRLLKGERFDQGARRLSDYLFHHIVRRSIDLGIPMVIHTGYLVGKADPKANVRHFAPVLETYPEARFDLYHLNYPWYEDLLTVLNCFPNTWANCCWAHITDPCGTIRFLQSALGTVPANHIFGYGGDFPVLPEPVLAHLEIAQENIAEVLGEAIRRHWCSRSAALDLARLWLHENPKEFYSI